MFRTLRVVPSLDLKGWVIEINGDLIGPVFSSAREAQKIFDWLTAASTELDLLFHTDWEEPDEMNFNPVS